MPVTIAGMIIAKTARRPVPALLANGLALTAVVIALSGEARLRLSFDVLPGAVYLALLSLPALLEKSPGSGVGTDAQIGAYLGPAYTARSALNLVQPGGTDLTFGDIDWEGKPFRPPIYYGYRATYWLPNSRIGLMGDFTHIKAIAVKERLIDQSGLRDGAPVPAKEPLSATLKRLEFTHGYNLFTINVLRRGMPRDYHLIPYIGAGLGVAIPHVEVQRVGAARTDEYQITGPALQLLGGIEWRFGRRLSLFVEYKLNCAMIHGDLVGGGKVSTNLCTHQLPVGLAVHLRARAIAP